MRTGILSDDHINLHCAKYRPVPMNMTDTILSHEMTRLKLGTSYNGKKLKYPMPIYRPLTFDHFARAATRLSGDPNFRETIHNMYAAQTGTGSTLMTVPPTGGAPAAPPAPPPQAPPQAPPAPPPQAPPQAPPAPPPQAPPPQAPAPAPAPAPPPQAPPAPPPQAPAPAPAPPPQAPPAPQAAVTPPPPIQYGTPPPPIVDYSTSQSSHGSSVEFTGDEYTAAMAQLHHVPLGQYAFKDPLNLEPRESSAGAGPSSDLVLELMTKQNAKNLADPKTPGHYDA